MARKSAPLSATNPQKYVIDETLARKSRADAVVPSLGLAPPDFFSF